MKIYTRHGDQGETQLLGGTRTSKLDIRIAACGVVDELNACLGLAAAGGLPAEVADGIARIQRELFELGAWIAAIGSQQSAGSGNAVTSLNHLSLERLENEIDRMESQLEPLRHFILPGGHLAAATLQLSRAICRRAEITLLQLQNEFAGVDFNVVGPWINRLSDWLFVAARRVNREHGVTEPKWNG